MAKWRAEGLCFKCDEKHYAGHVCKRPELTVLIISEDGTEEECTEEQVDYEEPEEGIEAGVAELSANSAVGLSSPRTMKVRGSIGEEEVVVIIDSGASHNFLSERLVEKLGITATTTTRYGVLVAGGVTVRGKGVIHNVKLKLQDCEIVTSFLPLELGIADVILGVQWLDTMGEMKVNWKLQRMTINLDGRKLTLRGDMSLHSVEVSFKALKKSWEKDGEGMIVEYGGLQAERAVEEGELSENWSSVVDRYAEVSGSRLGCLRPEGRNTQSRSKRELRLLA